MIPTHNRYVNGHGLAGRFPLASANGRPLVVLQSPERLSDAATGSPAAKLLRVERSHFR